MPVLYWLSGLTCTDENFVQKAGAQQHAAEHGIAIVCPDTSPRGEGVADDHSVFISYETTGGILKFWVRLYNMAKGA